MKKDKESFWNALKSLEKLFPECSFVLLVKSIDASDDANTDYVMVGSKKDAVAMMKSLLMKWLVEQSAATTELKQ